MPDIAAMNVLEQRTALPPRRHPARAGQHAGGGARRALDPHGAALRAGPHQPVAAARRDRRPRGLDAWSTAASARDEAKAQWEQVFATQLEGLPILRVIVTHMHPDHIGLAHWLCERWNAPLWISATDYNAARLGLAEHHRLRRRERGALLRLARPDRPGGGGEDPRPRQLLPRAWCRRCRAASAACMDGDTVAHRRARLALHQRLRPCARAHRAVLRRAAAC